MCNQPKKLTALRRFRLCVSLLMACILFNSSWQASAAQGSTTDSPGQVGGTLRDTDGPIKDADIYLQYFEDEKCSELFARVPHDKKETDKRSARDAPSITLIAFTASVSIRFRSNGPAPGYQGD